MNKGIKKRIKIIQYLLDLEKENYENYKKRHKEILKLWKELQKDLKEVL